uniref:Uncharacterized protein n=1 Tax=Lactuca sativa TaxID=4236 RepID=A0A9R1X6G5_LACSA|nr:hypothetical protein LSAT_V11C700348490 [Lactuca sativa]
MAFFIPIGAAEGSTITGGMSASEWHLWHLRFQKKKKKNHPPWCLICMKRKNVMLTPTGDAFYSMEDVGFLEVAYLSLDEPDFENDLIIDN